MPPHGGERGEEQECARQKSACKVLGMVMAEKDSEERVWRGSRYGRRDRDIAPFLRR